MKEVTAFKCDYCSMVSMYKGHVVRHEKYHCRKSPDRKCCKLCTHLNDDDDGCWCEELGGELQWERLNENVECSCFISKIIKHVG